MLTQALGCLLQIQVPVREPGTAAEEGLSAWASTIREMRAGHISRILASAWPDPGYATHLVS